MNACRDQRYFCRLCIYALAIGLMVLLAKSTRAQELRELPYVPTPQLVVDEMLKLAGVTAKDFVIDLGSGDGRMIITAAKDFKASGVGVDIDGKLVALANEQAKIKGVADQAKFIEQDMFKADISRASVVTLYVIPDFIEKLRAKLLAELKPGSRVVSHDYYMSGWYPDKRVDLTVPEKLKANGTDKAYLYLWVVPSVVGGVWRMEFDVGGAAHQSIVLAINQRYQVINATAENAVGALKLDHPALKGDEISFEMTVAGVNYRLVGKVAEGEITGTATSSVRPKPAIWRAHKLPAEAG